MPARSLQTWCVGKKSTNLVCRREVYKLGVPARSLQTWCAGEKSTNLVCRREVYKLGVPARSLHTWCAGEKSTNLVCRREVYKLGVPARSLQTWCAGEKSINLVCRREVYKLGVPARSLQTWCAGKKLYKIPACCNDHKPWKTSARNLVRVGIVLTWMVLKWSGLKRRACKFIAFLNFRNSTALGGEKNSQGLPYTNLAARVSDYISTPGVMTTSVTLVY